MNATDKNTIMVTCAKGLSEILQGEIKSLGYRVTSAHETGVEITGDLYDCMKLNLHLRTAFNVLYLLKHFQCGTDHLAGRVCLCHWSYRNADDREYDVCQSQDQGRHRRPDHAENRCPPQLRQGTQ
ncbi:MAG: hypothetical protein ACYSOJ_05725 [Planctomycetota bacterium]